MCASIFLELSLPNAATWFYASFLLAVTLFVRFDRPLSLRNWDIVALWLIIPGLLYLTDGYAIRDAVTPLVDVKRAVSRGDKYLRNGFIWLMAASVYWFGRCLFDLGLEKRPMLPPNISVAGMTCLAASLVVCLAAAAAKKPAEEDKDRTRVPVAVAKANDGAAALVKMKNGHVPEDTSGTRFWIGRAGAVFAHLVVFAGLVLIGARTYGDAMTGMAMGCLYLLLPCTAYDVIKIHHVWPSLFFLGAVYWHRRPAVAGALLGVAAGSVFFPALLFPLWFGFYRGRGAGRFAAGFLAALGLSLGVTAALLSFEGELGHYLKVARSLSDWQAWKAPTAFSIWRGTHWAYRLPVFIAYMAFIVLTMFWPSPRHLGQVIAQSAAVVIGVQFWYADQGGAYVLWYAPLLLLMIFRPNLTDARPPVIGPGPGPIRSWLVRRLKASGRPPAAVPASS